MEILVYLSRNLSFSLVSQLSVHCQSAGFHHCFSRANASISKSIFSKRPPWGLNIIMKIDSVKLAWSDSKGFTNVYCDQHLSLWLERCDYPCVMLQKDTVKIVTFLCVSFSLVCLCWCVMHQKTMAGIFILLCHRAGLDTIFVQIYMDAPPGVPGVSKNQIYFFTNKTVEFLR